MTPLPPLPPMGLSPEQLVVIAKWGHQVAKAERSLALLYAAELCERLGISEWEGKRYLTPHSDCAAMLRVEAERIK